MGLIVATLSVTSLYILLTPMERKFVESITVILRHDNGRPAEGIRVSEDWNAYSYNLRGGGDLITDERGQVSFPSVVARHNLLFWLVGPILTRIKYGVHSSSGISAHILISDPSVGPVNGFSCVGSQCSESPIALNRRVERN